MSRIPKEVLLKSPVANEKCHTKYPACLICCFVKEILETSHSSCDMHMTVKNEFSSFFYKTTGWLSSNQRVNGLIPEMSLGKIFNPKLLL